jgi:hypothetical protein
VTVASRCAASVLLAALAVALPLAGCVSSGERSKAGSPSTTTTITAPSSSAPGTTALRHALQIAAAPWSLPAPLSREVATALDGNILVLGGNRPGGTTPIVDAIVPATGQATRAGVLAAPVHDAAVGLIGGRPVVFGGGAAAASDVVQMLQAGGRTTVIGHLPQPRADHTATQIGDTAFVVGGYDGHALTPEVLATTDGAHFRTVGRLVQPVRYPAVAATADRIFVIGGATSGGESAGVDTDVVQVIDVRTGQVSVLAHLAATVSHAATARIGGDIYVLGGHVGGRWSDGVSRLDTATGALQPVGRLPAPVSDAAVAVLGPVAYLLGGERAPSTPVSSVVQLRA